MKKFVKILLIIPLVAIAVAVFGWLTMILWNWLIPVLFGGPVVTFWQALGLLVLSKILFSGLGKAGAPHCGYRKRDWRKKIGDMTPEERERFKRKFEDRWCRGTPPQATDNQEG